MNIDTDALLDSALLVLMGMAVVFTGLFILMVSATIVVRLSQRNNKKTEKRIERPPEVAGLSATGEAGKGTIAAMAVALALAMDKGGIAPSARAIGAASATQAETGSTWAAAGREQLMRSRGKVGHKWGRRSE